MTTLSQQDILVKSVPQSIAQTLNRLIHRSRTVILLRGMSAVAATAIAAFLVVMAIDASFTLFSMAFRWGLTLSAYAVTIAAAILFLFRPLAHSYTMAGIARLIETRHPELHERLSSAVELLTTSDAPELRGSDVLIAALAQEASRDATTVHPRREISLRPARPYLMAAAGVVGVLSLLLVLWPSRTSLLLARAFAPYLNLSNVSALDLEIQPSSDVTIPEGHRLAVEVATANPYVRSAWFLRTDDKAQGETSEEMTFQSSADPNDPKRRFSLVCPPAIGSFSFRIHAGDALSQFIRVTVVPRPVLQRLDLRYDFPAYTKRKVQVEPNSPGNIAAVAGTVVTVTATVNNPVALAELVVNDKLASSATLSEDRKTCTFQLTLEPKTRGAWGIRLIDAYKNEIPASDSLRAIEALADSRPEVRVTNPKKQQLRLNPYDKLPIDYLMRDDFGLASAEMLVAVDDRQRPPLAIPLPAPAKADEALRVTQGQTVLDLARLKLDNARRVTFQLRAVDTFPQATQEGLSARYTIELDIKEKSFQMQVLMAEELQVRQLLQEILKELEAAKGDSSPLRKTLAAKPAALDEDSSGKVGRIRKRLMKADSLIKDCIQAVAGKTFAAMGPELKDLSTKHVAYAQTLAGRILVAEAAQARSELADTTDFHIDRAIAIVTEMLKRFAVMTDAAKKAQEIQDIAERAKELAREKFEQEMRAKNPEAAKQNDQAMTPEQLQQAQERVADQLAEQVRQSPQAMQAAALQEQKQSQNLAQMARELSKEQAQLAAQTHQAAQAEEGMKPLDRLAAEQRALAKQTERSNPEAAKEMTQAAQEISAADAKAVEDQKAAEQQLQQQAQQARQQAGTNDLAKQAQQLAKEQAAVSKAAQEQAKDVQAAQEKAQAAEQAAQKANQDYQKAVENQPNKDAVKAKAAELARQEKALAQQAEKLQQEAAANPATENTPQRAKPLMEKTAENLNDMALQQAQSHAAQAAQQARQSDQQLDQAAQQAQQKAQQTAQQAQQAQQQAATAQQNAQQAQQQADAKKQAAQQAQQQAQAASDAAQKAQQAAQKAQESGNPQQQQAAQQAADQAKQQAQAAKNQADQAGQQAQNAQNAAQQAAQQAQAAQQQAADAQKGQQAAQQQAQAAQSAAQKAEQIAQAQEKLADQIRQLAGTPEGQQMAKAEAAAQQAAQQADSAENAAQQAGEKMKNLAQREAALQQAANDLAKQAQNASPQAQQAVAEHNPSQTMEQAAQAMKGAQGEQASEQANQAAQKAQQAAEQAQELADALAGQKSEQSPQVAQAKAQKAENLAAQQADLRRRTEQALQQAAQAAKPMQDTQLARLAAEQAQVAQEAAKLADQVQQAAPQSDRLDSQAAQNAQDAAQQLQQGQVGKAAEEAKQAAEQMEQLAQRVSGKAEQGEQSSQQGEQSGQKGEQSAQGEQS
ncbi:MAG TPA: hypothetical protein PKG77_17145, partial [Phycisphaerae bacterium]|nr:hypothetical protein [Phycisphaerae bacterium]